MAWASALTLMSQAVLGSVEKPANVAPTTERIFLPSTASANGGGDSLKRLVNADSLIHVWSQYGVSGRDLARHLIARQSWEREYTSGGWKAVVVLERSLRRTARTALGDSRKLPFVRDLLDKATARALGKGLVVFSNNDVIFAVGLTDTLRNVELCAFASRHEFVRLPQAPTCLEILCARKHCGADLFAMTPAWWRAHRRDYPDMLLGAPAWDMVMRRLMQLTGGIELHAALAHEEHLSHWLTHRSDPSATYNEALAAEWLAERDLAWV